MEWNKSNLTENSFRISLGDGVALREPRRFHGGWIETDRD
jgi:hypothetical protein